MDRDPQLCLEGPFNNIQESCKKKGAKVRDKRRMSSSPCDLALPKAGKGKGKAGGKSGLTKRTPAGDIVFTGKCDECGLIGHSVRNCPSRGKGFGGNCRACGIQGPSARYCPTQPGLRASEGNGWNQEPGTGIEQPAGATMCASSLCFCT